MDGGARFAVALAIVMAGCAEPIAPAMVLPAPDAEAPVDAAPQPEDAAGADARAPEPDAGALDAGPPPVDAGRDAGTARDAGPPPVCTVAPDTGCGSGRTCRLSAEGPRCESTGPMYEGNWPDPNRRCSASTDCQAGLFCRVGFCRRYCDPDGEACPNELGSNAEQFCRVGADAIPYCSTWR